MQYDMKLTLPISWHTHPLHFHGNKILTLVNYILLHENKRVIVNIVPCISTLGMMWKYVVLQKSNETDFLLTMNFILFTNQVYFLRNSSLGQLHSHRGVVSNFRSSAGRLLLEYLSACRLRSSGYYPKYQNGLPFKWVLSRGNKKKSQGLRSGE